MDKEQPVEGCTHRWTHYHGTYNAWRNKCCTCPKCARAGRKRQRDYQRNRMGHSGRTPATRARKHLATLENQGTPMWWVAQTSGVSRETITRIQNNPGWKITLATHDLLMAVKPRPHAPDPRYTDATGSRRKLQHLALYGWAAHELTHHCTLHRTTISAIRRGDRPWVLKTHAQEIETLTRKLWNRKPPTTTAEQKRVASLLRYRARTNGWVSLLAYNDPDDPNDHPTELAA